MKCKCGHKESDHSEEVESCLECECAFFRLDLNWVPLDLAEERYLPNYLT